MTQAAEPAFSLQAMVPTADQMAGLGGRIAGLLTAGDLVVLSGPLGAGLQVRGPVTSPTFVIARVHPSLVGGPDLVHADAYRLGSRAEVDDLDLDADLASSVTVVEWGEGLVESLAGSYLAIGIAAQPPAGPVDGGDEASQPRTVSISGWGTRWQDAAPQALQVLVSSA
jgi:tRNA threonylcarbamoyladenosine biosynthesis protein TsaE